MANNIFGIDLGTNNIKIYKRADDSIFVEKNMIAIENKKNYFAYGDSAFEMYEKAPGNIVASYPVSNGVIADIKNMESLLKYFINDLSDGNIKPADFYVAVPTDVTEVEKRAFYDLIKDANIKAKKIMVVEKAVAEMQDGDIVLLENVRFHKGEEKNDEELAKAFAKLADVYVNDAFGAAHRAHASTEGITKFVETSVLLFPFSHYR